MRHIVLDRWSQGTSPIHRRDARAKLTALFVFLVVVATAHRGLPLLTAILFVLLCAGFMQARLPVAAALARAGVVLPFTIVFALICWMGGDPARGFSLAAKSYLSALAVVLLIATTPLPALLGGLERMGVPSFLLLVGQFIYRYLFVIAEEAQQMARAAAARGASARRWAGGGQKFQAAAGALAVLFARSYDRAEQIHRAMLARDFRGEFRALQAASFRPADAVFAFAVSVVPVIVRIAAERVAL